MNLAIELLNLAFSHGFHGLIDRCLTRSLSNLGRARAVQHGTIVAMQVGAHSCSTEWSGEARQG
jgi:hypothetical protein